VSGGARLFVYYRVREEAAAEAALRVDALFAALAARGMPRGRLMRRRDEPLLWMEVYDPVDDPGLFARCLEAAAADLGFAALLVPGGARKVECFEDARPCA
jgi:hypothetical protein